MRKVIRRLLDWLGDVDTVQGLPAQAATLWKWFRRVVVPVLAIVYAWFGGLRWELQVPLVLSTMLIVLVLVRMAIDIYAAHRTAPTSPSNVQDQRRALVSSWRVMIGKAYQAMATQQKQGVNLSVLRVLEAYPEFHELRPHLSAGTRTAIQTLYVGNFMMAFTGTHPYLQRVSDEIDRIETEWGLR
jgi:hypothetical protein